MIERLIEEGIDFQVCVSRIYFKGGLTSKNYSGLDYALICSDKNLSRLREIKKEDGNFTFTRYHYNKVFHNMKNHEVRDFKAKQHLFKKVLHCEHGRVYELK